MWNPLSFLTDRVAPVTTPAASSPVRDPSSLKHQPPHVPDRLSSVQVTRPLPKEYSPSKPELPELRMIQTMGKLHDTGAYKFRIHLDEFDAHTKDLDQLLAKNLESLKEKAQRTQTNSYWDTLRRIGTGILSVVSTFLGLSVISAGGSTLIGGALIASGIMSLANLALTDAGLWDWVAEQLAADNQKEQERIAALIPCVVGFMAGTVGLAGFGAYALWGAMATAPRILTVAQTAANLSTMTAAIGGEVSQALVSQSQASLIDLQGKLALHGHRVERLLQGLETALQQETQTYRIARDILNLTIQTKQELLV
jgi:hypothetical protein